MKDEVSRYTKTWLSDMAHLVLELFMLMLLVAVFAAVILGANWVLHG